MKHAVVIFSCALVITVSVFGAHQQLLPDNVEFVGEHAAFLNANKAQVVAAVSDLHGVFARAQEGKITVSSDHKFFSLLKMIKSLPCQEGCCLWKASPPLPQCVDLSVTPLKIDILKEERLKQKFIDFITAVLSVEKASWTRDSKPAFTVPTDDRRILAFFEFLSEKFLELQEEPLDTQSGKEEDSLDKRHDGKPELSKSMLPGLLLALAGFGSGVAAGKYMSNQ